MSEPTPTPAPTPTSITVRERIIRDGKLLHRIGEELHAGYARGLGIREDGTDGQHDMELREAPGTGVPMQGVELQLGETGTVNSDGSGQALPPIVGGAGLGGAHPPVADAKDATA